MAKLSLYYLLRLEGALINLGRAKPIENPYLLRPTCTTAIVCIPATQTPPTATVYESIVTLKSSVKCSGCALTAASVVNEPVAECQIFDAAITFSASTVLSYVCEAEYTGSAVPTAANPTANDFTIISSLSPITLPTPATSNPTANDFITPTSPPPMTLSTHSTTTNPTANDFITPTPSTLITLLTSTYYTPTSPISSSPAKTVDGNANPVPSGNSGIIVRASCPQTKKEVPQCPLLCFTKSLGPNTPQFHYAKFFDHVLFHSCSHCLPPCDTPVKSVSATAGTSTTGIQSY